MAPAETFADRLPRLVPKEEGDISHLSDELADILYPGHRPRPFRMGLEFRGFEGPNYPRALELARASEVYREDRSGASVSHYAAWDVQGAAQLLRLFQIVGELSGTRVLVDGKPVPYAREIWLKLFWVFADESEPPC